jgi:hypothetical protein
MKLSLFFLLSFLTFHTINAQNYDWSVKWGAGGNNGCLSNDVAVDEQGNIYTTGVFQSQVDFDPGPAVFNLTASGTGDAFVSKIDLNGNFLWAVKFTGSGYIQGNSIDVDSQGNVYTTGFFGAPSGDFDPGSGTAFLSGSGNSIYVSKLDTDGNYIWAKVISGSGDERGTSIHVDNGGSSYLTGQFTSTADFDPNGGVASLIPSGGIDAFLLKLDSAGNYVWAKQISGTSDEYANDITIDASFNVITTGRYNGTIDLDPGLGTQIVTQTGASSDMFVVKLDLNGDLIFGNTITCSSFVQGKSIDTDGLNNIYITGSYQGTADFNSDMGLVYNLTSSASDGFVLKLNSLGVFQWTSTFISSSFCNTESIKVKGNFVYSTGYFNGTVDLDPGTGSSILSSSGSGIDIYISKLNTQGGFIWGGELNGSGVYMNEARGIAINNNNEIHVSGSFEGSVDFDPGVGVANLSSVNNSQGSSFVVKLTPQCLNSTSYISPITCESYVAPDLQVYTSSGIYTAIIPNAEGCDSTISIDLTINSNSSSTINEISCNNYTAPDGQIYTQTGVYSALIANSGGCDSLITINLTIQNVNAGISVSGITMSSTNSGMQYQWLNCATNQIIGLPTTQSFTPSTNGEYAVIVYDGSCSDTSDCITISSVSLIENQISNFTISPNPVTSFALIEGISYTLANEIELITSTGILVRKYEINGEQFLIDMSDVAAGIYFIKIEGGNPLKIVKQ